MAKERHTMQQARGDFVRETEQKIERLKESSAALTGGARLQRSNHDGTWTDMTDETIARNNSDIAHHEATLKMFEGLSVFDPNKD